jgi:hypothetical protein
MRIVDGLVRGPFKNEQEFKRTVLEAMKKYEPNHTCFEIENEEKEPGMPDVLSISYSLPAYLTEFKYSDRHGAVEFTKAQPLFYRRHCYSIRIQILAWDCRMGGRVVRIEPAEVISAKALRITIPADIGAVFHRNLKDGE